MKVAALGTCLANLTAVNLVDSFHCQRLNNLTVTRSDKFLNIFVDKVQALPPIEVMAEELGITAEDPDNLRQYLIESYPATAGVMELPQGSPSFFQNALTQNFDIILLDNLGDITNLGLLFKGVRYAPFMFNFPLSATTKGRAFWQDCQHKPYLTPEESAANWVRIIKFLQTLQPRARIFFLCMSSATAIDVPDRYARARGFYDAFSHRAKALNIDIVSPLEVPNHLTKLPEDPDHFDMSVYRGLAGLIYLASTCNWSPVVYGHAVSGIIPCASDVTGKTAVPAAPPMLKKYGRQAPAATTFVRAPHKLCLVIAKFLGLPSIAVTEESGANVTEKWDSLSQLNVVSHVERVFGVSFAFNDTLNANSVRAIREALRYIGVLAADEPEEIFNIFSGFADRALAHPDTRFALFVSRGQERELTNGWVLAQALGVAQRLQRVPRGATIAIVLDHSEHLYTSFIGCVLAGLVPTILPPITVKQDKDFYRTSMAVLFARIQPAALITARTGAARFETETIFCDEVSPVEWPQAAAALAALGTSRAGDVAFLQHSSGTTGHKKGVELTHGQVHEQISRYAASIGLAEGDPVVSWLPLYHDMGLITSFVMPAMAACPIVSLDALEWTARPTVLFDYLEQSPGAFAWLPNFAFHHIARTDATGRSWNLGGVKAIINCSEPAREASFAVFLERYGTMGLTRDKLGVCYAMAEMVFAVTQTNGVPSPAYPPYLSSGIPLPDVEIEIRDETGAVLPAGGLGEIFLRAPFMFCGYNKLPELTDERIIDGWYRTRDLGTMIDGTLFVIGRLDDVLIINGKNIVAHEVEDALNDVEDIAPGRVLVGGLLDEALGSDRLAVLAEARSDNVDRKALSARIRGQVLAACGVAPATVDIVPRGWLVKSSSGKLARAQSWEKWQLLPVSGDLMPLEETNIPEADNAVPSETNLPALLEQIETFQREGNAAAAYALLKTAMTLAPGDPWVAWKHARVAQDLGRAETESCWRSLVATFPDFALTHLGLAEFLQRTGRPEGTEEMIVHALRLDPVNHWALKAYAEVAQARGDWVEALVRWRNLQAIQPDFWLGFDCELRLLETMGAWAELAQRLAEVALLFPNESQLPARLAEVVNRHGLQLQPSADADSANSPREVHWDTAAQFERAARKALAAGSWYDADALLQRGLRRFPDSVELLGRWAQAATERSNLPTAAARWAVARERRPDFLDAYIAAADVLHRLEMPRAAIAVLQAAKSAGFNTPAVIATLATQQRLAGDHAGAMQTLAAVRLPDVPGAERPCLLDVGLEVLQSAAPEVTRRAALMWLLNEPPEVLGGWLPKLCQYIASLPQGSRRQAEMCSWLDTKSLVPTILRPAWAEALRAAFGHAPLTLSTAGAPLLLIAPTLTSLPLTEPIDGAENAALEAARQEIAVLLEHMNRPCADRRLRAYQAEIYTTGRMVIDLAFLSEDIAFFGTLFLAGPKAYAWGFGDAHHTVWLVVEGGAQAFEIIAFYLSSHRLLFGRGLATGSRPTGTLASMVTGIDALPDRDHDAAPDARALLHIGNSNYAHCLWNEYPALIEAETLTPSADLEAQILYEPFGPVDEIIRLPPEMKLYRRAVELGSFTFSRGVMFSLGATLITDVTRERVLAVTHAEKSVRKLPADRFVLWISLRVMYRCAVNEAEALFCILQKLSNTGGRFEIILDGFSLPDDLYVPGRYNIAYHEDHARRTAAMSDALIARCTQAGLSGMQFRAATRCTLSESIRAASEADYYICHHGTQQHKIGWMFDLPGMIHANVALTRIASAPWAQQQAGVLHCPRYVPGRFIGDAESDGERQSDSYFRDYMFIDLTEMADFVVADIVHHLQAKQRHRGIIAEVLAAREPNEPLRRHLNALEAEANPRLICDVFESLVWRANLQDYWIFAVVAAAYQAQDRHDAAFLIACAAQQISPEAVDTQPLRRILSGFLHARGLTASAMEVSRRSQAAHSPDVDIITPSNPEEIARATQMTAVVLAAPNHENQLLILLEELDKNHEYRLGCDLFENVFWQIKVTNYWIYFRVVYFYGIFQRPDAAFLMAAFADHLDPWSPGNKLLCREMFGFFRGRDRSRDALDVFFAHSRRPPFCHIAWLSDVSPLLADAEVPVSTLVGEDQMSADEAHRRTIRVIPEEVRPPWTYKVYGGTVPAFDPLAKASQRSAIDVICIPYGEVLIASESFAVCDVRGVVHTDLSTYPFPLLLKRHMDALQQGSRTVDVVELDEAVLIDDAGGHTANLCHFLLDQFTRLEIYRRAGLDLTRQTVIGLEATTDFQRHCFAQLGIKQLLPTGRVARVRARRLWVSTNCKSGIHPAHQGARWAIDFLRQVLVPDGRTMPKRRIYVSRRDATARRVTNESEVMDLLKPWGFELIVPGTLSFQEQVEAFANATHVVGPHGAGLTNIVVCQSGTHVLEIFHPLYSIVSYASLAPEGGLYYAAMVGRDGHSDAPEFNDPFHINRAKNTVCDIRVDLNLLEEWLNETCHDTAEFLEKENQFTFERDAV